MELLGVVFVAAILVEGLVQVVKTWVPEGIVEPGGLWPVVSAVFGVVLCVLGKLDILHIAGIRLEVPLVGALLTGVLISRGASFIHDLWAKVQGKEKQKEDTEEPIV